MKKFFMLLIPIVAVACGSGQKNKDAKDAAEPAEVFPAIDLADLDTTVRPQDDFYQYSTGGWQKANPLRPEFSRFGSFDVIRERTEEQLNAMFKAMTDLDAPKGSVDQKIADLYKMGLDSTGRNAAGAAPILPDLERLKAISSNEELTLAVAELHNFGESSFFGAYVEADLTDSDSQVLYIGQGGLGMGDRDYYLLKDNAALKEGYRNFLVKVFTLAGLDNPEGRAADAVSVEDAMAKVSWTREQQRDMLAIYNPMSSEQLAAAFPAFDFDAYFAARGIEPQAKLIVGEPSYFRGLDIILGTTPLEKLKNYVIGQFVAGACGALSDDFYTASWEFFSHQMSGAEEQKPRWKRAMGVPNSLLGEAVGKMYVEKYFPESSKKQMEQLVENLRAALLEHINELDWMSEDTKVKAREKLAAFTVKIGYPDKWKDYSTLEVDPSVSYYENLKRAGAWYVADNLSHLGKPTDKTEWGMTPQTVNAYYNPTTNEICFPAAILQRPFFNPDADDPVNYGGIGVVIGHEMSHGFDDQGRQFDADGNMVNWWTPEDEAKFKEKAEVLAAQFDEIDILPGIKAKGHRTLGENIGDHGGISIAYTAMENAMKDKSREPIDGFTPEQRFFLSYGIIWAQNITDQEKARLTNLDVHSLAENRVNVSLRNFQQFFDAFGIQEGDKMWRPESERVHIW